MSNPGSSGTGRPLGRRSFAGGLILPQLNLTPVGSDNFNRANGAIAGANGWAALTAFQGGASIAANEIQDTGVSQTFGNFRTDTYSSDQYSQAAIGSQLPGANAWIGVSTRNQDAAGNCYLAILINNGGTPNIQLYKQVAGVFTQLGPSNSNIPGPVVGQVLSLVSEGNQHTVSLNGVTCLSLTDATYAGGTPGFQVASGALGAANAYLDNWAGGNAATAALAAALASDAFTAANGNLSVQRPNWAVSTYSPSVGATIDCVIAANQLSDTNAVVHSADARTDSGWNSDQWAQIQQGTIAMSASGFVGATIRNQNGGRSCYLAVFFQNNSYALYRLDGGGAAGSDHSTLLGGGAIPAVTIGNDPAGTPYTIVGKGSRISMRVGAHEIISVTDSTYVGGVPGLMLFGTSSADNWAAGNV